jgi:lipopolysaccharide export system permease protein
VIKKIDKYILLRLFTITVFVLLVLVFIFIVIDFSEHSEDFTDRGATFAEIFGVYYLNYIPEIIRLISPLAIFIACLYLTGQMSERLEITALKASGVSLYRLLVPYLIFAFIMTGTISYMDGFLLPDANEKRIEFESKYLQGKSEKVRDRSDQWRFGRRGHSGSAACQPFRGRSNRGVQHVKYRTGQIIGSQVCY